MTIAYEKITPNREKLTLKPAYRYLLTFAPDYGA